MSYDIFNPVTAQNPYTYAGNTPIRLIDLVGGLSSDPLNPSWTTPCINQNSVSPTSKSLSGGAPAAARTLIHTGDLREEYTRRSSQIPIDISNEEQSAIRTHLKEEIRSRSNFFAKACLKEIDRKRELKKSEGEKSRSAFSLSERPCAVNQQGCEQVWKILPKHRKNSWWSFYFAGGIQYC